MELEKEPGKATIFSSFSHPKTCESIFLGASTVELFHSIPFGRKRLQTTREVAGEALPNGPNTILY
jgi:hypothetical protein